MNTIRCTIAIMLFLLVCLPKSLSAQTLTDPQPLNAVEAILAAFDKFPIVALGEAHGL